MSFYACSLTDDAVILTADSRAEMDGAVYSISKLRYIAHLGLVMTAVAEDGIALEGLSQALSVAAITRDGLPDWLAATAKDMSEAYGVGFQAVVAGCDTTGPYAWFVGPQSDYDAVQLQAGGLTIHPTLTEFSPAVLAAGDAVAGGGVAAIGALHDAYAHAVVDNGLPIGGKLSRVVVTAEGANFAAVGDLG